MEASATVTVTGHGSAAGAPDMATVNLGVEVRAATAVVEVVEGSTPFAPLPRQAKAMAFGGAVPIEAGSQSVTVDVTVTYRLVRD